MILSATTLKILGFLDGDNLVKEAKQYVLVLLDNGNPAVIKILGTKKDMTEKDIQTFIEIKRDSTQNEKHIKLLASEIEESEEFLSFLDEELQKEENKSLSRKEQKELEKKLSFDKATEFFLDKKTIKAGSIVRTVIDVNEEEIKTYSFKNQELPLYNSRCIIFKDQDTIDPQKGLYFYSQNDNSIPITIEPLFNKDKEPLNLFKVYLSKNANLNNFNFLAKHNIRSLEKQRGKERIVLQSMNYNYDKVKSNEELFSVLKKIDSIAKNKEAKEEDLNEYISLLNQIILFVNKNNKLLPFVNLPISLMLNGKDLIKMTKEKDCPLKKLSKTFVDLNYSKENPEVKEEYSKEIQDIVNEKLIGNIPCKINAIYFIPTESIIKESSSWGFMQNNIQRESFVLSFDDIFEIKTKIS